MPLFRLFAALALMFTGAAAFADTDCTDPVDQWKGREVLRQQVQQRGWTVQRIKVDDGCYEVRAIDRKGNKIKAKYAPASLRIQSLEVEFGPRGDPADYLGPEQSQLNQREPSGPVTKGKIP